MAKLELTLPDGGPTVSADLTKVGLVAIHRALGDVKGFVLTHVPTGRVILRLPLKRDAVAARKELESLSWDDLASVREKVREILFAVH
jgi:hypothetical protein